MLVPKPFSESYPDQTRAIGKPAAMEHDTRYDAAHEYMDLVYR